MRKCGLLCRPPREQTCAWLYVYISMHVFAFGLCVVRLWFVGSGSSPGVQKIRIQEGTQTHYQNLTFRAIWLLFLGSSVVGVLGAAQAPRKSGSRKAPKLITKALRFVPSCCFFLAQAWSGGSGSSPGAQKIRIQEGTQTHYQNLTFRAIWLLFLGSSVVGVLEPAQTPRNPRGRRPNSLPKPYLS